MTLTLRIDNLTSLPDGGPMEFRVDQAGFEIGRDPNTDWTLPDPSRFVSSRHLEIRFSEGGYWLHDVSTNGTFVNGATMRVKSPYALRHGDRLQVGHYLVVVDLGGGQAPADPMGAGAGGATPGGGSDIWSVGTTPPPASAGFDPMPRPNTPLPDFGSQHIDNPAFGPGPDSPEPFPSPDPSAAVVKDFGAFGAAEEESDSPFGGPAPSKPEPPLKGDPSKAQSLAQPDSSAEPPSPFRSPEQTAPPPEPGAAAPARPISSPVFAPGAGEPVARPDFPPSSPEWEPEAPASEAFLQSPPAKAPEPAPPRKPSSSGQADWLNLICESAGLPPGTLNGADPDETAREIGASLRIVADELAGLLRVRAEAKHMVKSGSRTMLGHDANNPLKFIPTGEEALGIMFGQGRAGFQRGSDAIKSSFHDIKQHQFATHAALQPAIAELLEDLSPEAIEEKIEGHRFSSKSAKAWEIFVERWDAKTRPYENGMLDVFLAYFAKAYDDCVSND